MNVTDKKKMDWLRKARNSGICCDAKITLIDPDNKIHLLCHKILLYSFSQFFRNKIDRWDTDDVWELHVPNAIVTEYLILRECYAKQSTKLNTTEQELWIIICKDYLCVDLSEEDFKFMYNLVIEPKSFELLCRATNCISDNSYVSVPIVLLRNMQFDTSLCAITDKNLLMMFDMYKNNKCYCLMQDGDKLKLLDLGVENIKSPIPFRYPKNIEHELFDVSTIKKFARTRKGIMIYHSGDAEIAYITDFILITQFSPPTILKGFFKQKILFLTTHPNHSIVGIVFDNGTIGILNTETFFPDQLNGENGGIRGDQQLTLLIKDIPKKISRIDISTDGKYLVATISKDKEHNIYFWVFNIEKSEWHKDKYSCNFGKIIPEKISFRPDTNSLACIISYSVGDNFVACLPKTIITCFGSIEIICIPKSKNRNIMILPGGKLNNKNRIHCNCHITPNGNIFCIKEYVINEYDIQSQYFKPCLIKTNGWKLFFKEYFNVTNSCLTPCVVDWRFQQNCGRIAKKKNSDRFAHKRRNG